MGNTPAFDSYRLDLLATAAPSISCELAAQLAGLHFDVDGVATPLSSERDQNFHLRTSSGPDYVLKLANPQEHPEATDFQTQALLQIEARDPTLAVPRVCRTREGATSRQVAIDGKQLSTMRLLSYLPGIPAADRPSTRRLRTHLGQCLARLDKALRDLNHPGSKHGLLWNMEHATELTLLLDYLPDAKQRALVGRYLARFEQDVLPVFPSLRSQVIFNDLNPGNVLLDPADEDRPVGIIDFGDMVHGPLIVDVAVAAAYQLRHTPDPFDAVTELVTAYHRKNALHSKELDALYDLIATRLAAAIVITCWRATLHPENQTYILRNASFNYDMLRRIETISRQAVQQQLATACSTV